MQTDAEVAAIAAGPDEHERLILPHLGPDEGLVYPIADTAERVGIPVSDARKTAARLRAKRLAQHGPLYNEDTGAPHGSGTWWTPLGQIVAQHLKQENDNVR